MHELSIAESIVSSVLNEIKVNNYKRVTTIGLRIGELTDIVEDSLLFGMEAMTKETPLEGVTLRIERVLLGAKCPKCAREFEIKEFHFICPSCASGAIEIVSGQELEISYLTIED